MLCLIALTRVSASCLCRKHEWLSIYVCFIRSESRCCSPYYFGGPVVIRRDMLLLFDQLCVFVNAIAEEHISFQSIIVSCHNVANYDTIFSYSLELLLIDWTLLGIERLFAIDALLVLRMFFSIYALTFSASTNDSINFFVGFRGFDPLFAPSITLSILDSMMMLIIAVDEQREALEITILERSTHLKKCDWCS